MQITDAEFGQVTDPVLDAGEIPGEPLGVGGVAEHVLVQEPTGVQRALHVQSREFAVTLGERDSGRPDQPFLQRSDLIGLVHGDQPVVQVVPPAVQPQAEQLASVHRFRSQCLVGQGMDVGGRGCHGEIVHQRPCSCPRHRQVTGPGTGCAADTGAQCHHVGPTDDILTMATVEYLAVTDADSGRCSASQQAAYAAVLRQEMGR